MATVKKQGRGYKITVSNGIDINGKKIREHMTWIPSPGMTNRQIEKELERQKVMFEEKVKHINTRNGNIRFVDFSAIFMKDYAVMHLKPKTVFNYENHLEIINQAIGHLKLKDIKPGHIASFYANLQESGIRRRISAVCKIDFDQWMKENNTSMAALSRSTGLSIWAFKQARAKNNMSIENANNIAQLVGNEISEVFTIVHNKEPLKPTTIHTYHRILSAVLSRAIKLNYIDKNPASGIDLPSLAGQEAAYLDEDDARRVLELLQKEPIRWRTFFIFDLLSGLRRGELAGLRWEDVNFEEHTIQIRQTSNYIPSKGVYTDTTKSVSSKRPLHLSKSAFLLLLKYREWQDDLKAKVGDLWEDTDGRIFTTDIGAPIFPDSISQWFSKFIKRNNLPKVTVHSLRHTYASMMISDGVPLVVVSSQLGHAQTSTTANIYAHVIKSAEAKAAQTFEKFDNIISDDEQGDNKVIAKE